jgi:hypothetical protein
VQARLLPGGQDWTKVNCDVLLGELLPGGQYYCGTLQGRAGAIKQNATGRAGIERAGIEPTLLLLMLMRGWSLLPGGQTSHLEHAPSPFTVCYRAGGS